MTTDHHPRYVMLEQKQDAPDGRGTVFTILDSWYCWEAVWRGVSHSSHVDHGRVWLPTIRRRAHLIMDRLNADHDAWLADA